MALAEEPVQLQQRPVWRPLRRYGGWPANPTGIPPHLYNQPAYSAGNLVFRKYGLNSLRRKKLSRNFLFKKYFRQ